VWEWWAADQIPVSEVPSAWCANILGGTSPYDAYHMNSVEPDGDGYIVSFRHLDAVYRFRTVNGQIDWKLGGTPRAESLTVINDPNSIGDDLFRGQHDARLLPDGTLTLHDNGYHPGATRAPRAPRYAIDTSAGTATLLEQKTDPEAISTPVCCGSVRVLSGGDWVISWGSANRVTELAPDGSRVLKLEFTGTFAYRAIPIEPGVVSRSQLRAAMDAQYGRTNVRPKGATPVRVPLVIAYSQCTSPDTTHGAPLSFGSCSSPHQASSYLTAGTPDANGQQANFSGYVRYGARPGDPLTPANEADVLVKASLTDVRNRSDLSDYQGELQVHTGLRITDRQSGSSGSDPATGLDTDFPVTVPCTATASTATGSTCAVSTTLDALVPGAVVEGKRASWELGQVQVWDGGASGVAGASDARLFADEGIFVP